MTRIRLSKTTPSLLTILVLVGCMTAISGPKVATIPPTLSVPPTALPPTATPLSEGAVVLKQIDTIYIGGTIYGQGENAVILASRGGYSQYEWSPFAMALAREGYTVLTLGSSDGEGTTVEYVRYAIEYLRTNGLKRIVCIGASNGASGCAFNAHEPELRGIVLLTYHGNADLTDITYPKIFIAGGVSVYQNNTTKGYKFAADPKTLVIIPDSTDTGPSLLDTPGLDLNKKVLDMLKDVFGQ